MSREAYRRYGSRPPQSVERPAEASRSSAAPALNANVTSFFAFNRPIRYPSSLYMPLTCSASHAS